jgi:hypothetical protein
VSIRQHNKVVAYGNIVRVRNVEFRVRPAGVKRIRARGQREVIAWARGDAEILDALDLPSDAVRVCFDPFVHDSFVLTDGTPVHACDALYMTSPCGQWAVNPR